MSRQSSSFSRWQFFCSSSMKMPSWHLHLSEEELKEKVAVFKSLRNWVMSVTFGGKKEAMGFPFYFKTIKMCYSSKLLGKLAGSPQAPQWVGPVP